MLIWVNINIFLLFQRLRYLCKAVVVYLQNNIFRSLSYIQASQVALVVKNEPTSAGDIKRHGFHPWVGKILWRRAWQPTPVFLAGESHGQRSLAGYSP